MSDIGKVRLRVPSTIKPGDVIRVRSLVIHPMERIERDKQGKVIERNYNYINKVVGHIPGQDGRHLRAHAERQREPILLVHRSRHRPGPLKVTFTDTAGGRYEGSADIKFA